MIGIDTNVLVALAAGTHPDHQSATRTFNREAGAGQEIAIGSIVAAEFLHVITDPKRFAPPHKMSAAVQWLEAWSLQVSPVWLCMNEAAAELWLRWMKDYHLGRKRIIDTQYAALLHNSGVKRLLTNNAADYRVFGVFELVTF